MKLSQSQPTLQQQKAPLTRSQALAKVGLASAKRMKDKGQGGDQAGGASPVFRTKGV